MNPLTALPPRVRQAFYVVAASVGLFLGACQVYDAHTLFGGAVDVDKALQVLGYVSVALGLTAASNLPSYEDVAEGDAAPPQIDGRDNWIAPDDRGEITLVGVLVVVLVVAVIFAITRAL
jgi:hypothetical protein